MSHLLLPVTFKSLLTLSSPTLLPSHLFPSPPPPALHEVYLIIWLPWTLRRLSLKVATGASVWWRFLRRTKIQRGALPCWQALACDSFPYYVLFICLIVTGLNAPLLWRFILHIVTYNNANSFDIRKLCVSSHVASPRKTFCIYIYLCAVQLPNARQPVSSFSYIFNWYILEQPFLVCVSFLLWHTLFQDGNIKTSVQPKFCRFYFGERELWR